MLVGAAFQTEHHDMLLGYELAGYLHRGPWKPVWQRQGSDGGGVITGSGGAFLVLESREHAETRGRKAYAQLGPVFSDRARRRKDDFAGIISALAAKAGLPTLLTTVAVEAVANGQIAELAGAGIVVSLGHTDAGYVQARAAFEAGASMATHLFNAMSQLGNREPGLVGAVLESGAWAGLIADGIHVDPASIAIALRAKNGPGRIFLVTDAMSPIGTNMERFTLNGREIVRKDGALRLADGTLAGADLTMIDAVRFVHRTIRLPLDEVLRMASLYPAQAIGRAERLGHLGAGAEASIVHLSDDLAVEDVWVAGARIAL
jgi:N-acetylglucosamine-6-phosphate deacetylase